MSLRRSRLGAASMLHKQTAPPAAHSDGRRRGGFTLIEVLLVLVILVILGSLVGIQYRSFQKKALLKAAQAQIGMFKQALEFYQLDMGNYPSTSAGLEALRTVPADLENTAKWGPDPYLAETVPLDPWDHQYQYLIPGKVNLDSYDIWSLGPDGQDGTEDDIGNWKQP